MKNTSIINRFKKAGYTVSTSDNGNKFEVVSNDSKRICSWYDQSGSAICVHVQRTSEQSDPHTDYFPGYFCDTIKQAVNYVSSGDCSIGDKLDREIAENDAIAEASKKDAEAEEARIIKVENLKKEFKKIALPEGSKNNNFYIVINWSESCVSFDGATFGSFELANEAINLIAEDAPKNGAYDKTNFSIFVNGESVYTGRIDVQHKEYKDNDFKGIAEHIDGYMIHIENDGERYYNMTSEEIKERRTAVNEILSFVAAKPEPVKVLTLEEIKMRVAAHGLYKALRGDMAQA
jgi:hypothetical protein